MEILKIDKYHPNLRAIKKAVEVMRAGGVIVYPTDTAYGLGCDAAFPTAVGNIFKIKQRSNEKSLPLIAGNVAMVRKLCKIDSVSAQLIKKYWPGPLTLVLSCRPSPNPLPRGERTKVRGKIAFRVPDYRIARLLSLKLGRPIVSTSANISGKSVCYSIKSVLRQFGHSPNPLLMPQRRIRLGLRGERTKVGGVPDLILDAGPLPRRKPSTIVEVKNNNIIILRSGAVGVS